VAAKQLGIDVTFYYKNESATTLQAQMLKTLRYAKTLKANSIAITFAFYISGPTADAVTTGNGTPSPSQIGYFVDLARAQHFFVLLRPVVNEVNPLEPWRGAIEPANRSAWFASYDAVLAPYLVAAQKAGANEIAISCELRSLGGDSHWKSTVVPFVKARFHGLQMMDVSWAPTGMDPVAGTTFGIDAYHPLIMPDTATVAQLVKGWDSWLKRQELPLPTDKIYITEVGIAAQSKAYTYPQKSDWGTPIVPSIQTNWFDAACTFFKTNKFLGIYFFATNLLEGPQTQATGGYPSDFQGSTNLAISKCF